MIANSKTLQRRTTELEVVRETTGDMSSVDCLRWALQRYRRRVAIVTSFQKEGMVILDMATRLDPTVRVMTIDTGRLHEDTYSFMDEVRERYGIEIEIHLPDSGEVRKLVSRQGMNLFYKNVNARQACCAVRKSAPLKEMLRGLDAWITGLRKEQSRFRFQTQKVETDHRHGLTKLNPLAEWTDEQVDDYISLHDVPRNPLYDKGYLSIGCEPCTRPVRAGEDSRAGRWWWEGDSRKECGIHCRP